MGFPGGSDGTIKIDCFDPLAVQGPLKGLLQHHSSKASTFQHSAFPSEKAMAHHSSTLAWKIPWMEEPGRRSPWGRTESDRTERLHFHFSLSCIGEGNGNPHGK